LRQRFGLLSEEAAEVGVTFSLGNAPEVFAAEGELTQGSAPPVDPNALTFIPRPGSVDQYLNWFQGQDNGEDEEQGAVMAETPVEVISDESWSDGSPSGLSMGSPQAAGLSYPSHMDWELPEVD
jgi:hypothetical protein